MRWAKLLYLALGAGLLALALSEADLAQVARHLQTVGALGVSATVGLYFLAFVGDSISWSLIMTSLPVRPVWFRRAFVVRLAGEAFNNVVPAAGFAGEPVKATILKRRYGVSYREAAASIVMARTVNMVALIAFLVIGFAFMAADDGMPPALKVAASIGLAMLSLGTALLFVLQRYRVSTWIVRHFANRPWATKAAGALELVEDLDRRFVTFYTAHRGRFAVSLLLAFANWVLGVAEIYVVFLLLGAPVGWSDAWMIEALAQMVRSAVFFIPLAIGAQEGTFLVIVAAITGSADLGIACAAIRRIREFLWIGLGLVAWAAYPGSLKQAAAEEVRSKEQSSR